LSTFPGREIYEEKGKVYGAIMAKPFLNSGPGLPDYSLYNIPKWGKYIK
jgi:hypothetical protein